MIGTYYPNETFCPDNGQYTSATHPSIVNCGNNSIHVTCYYCDDGEIKGRSYSGLTDCPNSYEREDPNDAFFNNCETVISTTGILGETPIGVAGTNTSTNVIIHGGTTAVSSNVVTANPITTGNCNPSGIVIPTYPAGIDVTYTYHPPSLIPNWPNGRCKLQVYYQSMTRGYTLDLGCSSGGNCWPMGYGCNFQNYTLLWWEVSHSYPAGALIARVRDPSATIPSNNNAKTILN